jgi:hypothetical protein
VHASVRLVGRVCAFMQIVNAATVHGLCCRCKLTASLIHCLLLVLLEYTMQTCIGATARHQGAPANTGAILQVRDTVYHTACLVLSAFTTVSEALTFACNQYCA